MRHKKPNNLIRRYPYHNYLVEDELYKYKKIPDREYVQLCYY